MKPLVYAAALIALCWLTACVGPSSSNNAIPSLASPSSATSEAHGAQAPRSLEFANLDYSNGSITIYSVQNGQAKVTKQFTPGNGLAQGLAMDESGYIYTTITASNSKPCAACVEVFTSAGKLVASLPAPILQGAPGAPALTDVSVDSHDNVYVSDYGQQAVYYFPNRGKGGAPPIIVVQNSQNAASVLAIPSGLDVLVSGGCGFASVRPYRLSTSGHYAPGSCFGIGTIALIGGAADDQTEVLTPVDGVPGLVSVSSPNGGAIFHTPDRLASISGVTLNRGASIAYVANHHKECIYAFARPTNGWLAGTQPKLLATDKGFANLDIIALRP